MSSYLAPDVVPPHLLDAVAETYFYPQQADSRVSLLSRSPDSVATINTAQ